MKPSMPKIDSRDRAKILALLQRHVCGYLPGWIDHCGPVASALMQAVTADLSSLVNGLNKVPRRNLLAFLDMAATHLLPAQAARAPLVFSLIDNSPVDVTLPIYSQAAAPARLPAPSPQSGNTDQRPEPEPVVFSTEKTITLSRGRLVTLYSIKPGSDEYADHSLQLTEGFTLFDQMKLTEHAIYLGHDLLFALAGDVTILLSLSFQPGAGRILKTQWEYLTDSGWLPLASAEQDDTTGGLHKDGQIALRRECGPKSKKETFEGHESYWIRGRLTTPLLPDGTDDQRTVPVINDIRVRVGITRADLLADAAFADAITLDTSKDFYPFGQQPVRASTFYLASKEVFQRKGAQIKIDLTLSQPGTARGNVKLEWEYHDGSTWSGLGIASSTGSDTYNFTSASATITFLCPTDWSETTVNGSKNYWLRIRIVAGSYGSSARLDLAPSRNIVDLTGSGTILTVDSNDGYFGGESVQLIKGSDKSSAITVDQVQGTDTLTLTTAVADPEKFKGGIVRAPDDATPKLLPATLQPPIVSMLTLGYSYLTDPDVVNHCLAINDFVFSDHTEAAHWPDLTFTPFQPVADRQPAVHFGFDRSLPTGLISLYLDVPLLSTEDIPAGDASPFLWEYRTAHGWMELDVLDETAGFRRSSMIQFIGQPDAVAVPGLGGQLFRIRARLKQGETVATLPARGLWLNAVWASHRTTRENEPLGTSDGNPDQSCFVQRPPLLDGENVWVQEWTGRGDAWQINYQELPANDLRLDRDPVDQVVTAVWVRWYRQEHFYKSGASDRHYIVERARGLVRFGDGCSGLIPPAGSRITVTYSTGGGPEGNVPAGAISELRTAAPFVVGVTNPSPSSGGAAIETVESVTERGPQRLRHRDYAVSQTDWEWLAREASPDVARVRCLPLTGPAGHAQRGWATIIVAPYSQDPQPQLTPQLRRRIRDHLAQRVPAAVVRHVRVIGPSYTAISVRAEIVPSEPDQAAAVETRVRDNLNRFLHPLSGGPQGQGWQFGESVYLSQIARVIEKTRGVDHAREITLSVNGAIFNECVPVERDILPTAGPHELKLTLSED